MDSNSLSIAICCHNSAARLPLTLESLTAQNVNFPWEVLVVDNASTDETCEIAQRWVGILPLRVVSEPELGLTHARHRALQEAHSPFLAFLDDDNQVGPNWAARVVGIFGDHPQMAALGGPIVEVCASQPPFWFQQFKGNYTIWNPRETPGPWDGPLCGAGLCVRRSAWLKLLADGFQPLLVDRRGASLSSGGDFELTAALRLAGWTLWYDPELLVEHHLPASRLNWRYLSRLNEGFGSQSVYLDAYRLEELKPWWQEALRACSKLVRQLPALVRRREGDAAWLLALGQWGRLITLLRERTVYQKNKLQVCKAAWRKQNQNHA